MNIKLDKDLEAWVYRYAEEQGRTITWMVQHILKEKRNRTQAGTGKFAKKTTAQGANDGQQG